MIASFSFDSTAHTTQWPNYFTQRAVMIKSNASEIQQGTGASYKFKLIDKLTPHERSCFVI